MAGQEGDTYVWGIVRTCLRAAAKRLVGLFPERVQKRVRTLARLVRRTEDLMPRQHGQNRRRMSLRQPHALRMIIHDKQVAIAVTASQEHYRVMSEAVVHRRKPFDRSLVIEPSEWGQYWTFASGFFFAKGKTDPLAVGVSPARFCGVVGGKN